MTRDTSDNSGLLITIWGEKVLSRTKFGILLIYFLVGKSVDASIYCEVYDKDLCFEEKECYWDPNKNICRSVDNGDLEGTGESIDVGLQMTSQFKWDRDSGYIQLQSDPNYCLHTKGPHPKKDGGVHLWECNASGNGRWFFQTVEVFNDIKVGRFRVDYPNQAICLHKYGLDSPSVGDRLNQWDCNLHINAAWILYPNGSLRSRQNRELCFGRQNPYSPPRNGEEIVLTNDCEHN